MVINLPKLHTELRFRAMLIESGARVLFHREVVGQLGEVLA